MTTTRPLQHAIHIGAASYGALGHVPSPPDLQQYCFIFQVTSELHKATNSEIGLHVVVYPVKLIYRPIVCLCQHLFHVNHP